MYDGYKVNGEERFDRRHGLWWVALLLAQAFVSTAWDYATLLPDLCLSVSRDSVWPQQHGLCRLFLRSKTEIRVL